MAAEKLPKGIERRSENTFRLIVWHGYANGKQQRYYRTVEVSPTMTERARIKEAERLRALFMAEVERGETTNARQLTVEAFAHEWMEQYVKAKGLSPVTIADYQRTIDRHIVPELGNVKLAKLTPLMLTRYYNELHKQDSTRGRAISTRYVLHIHGVLRTMLNAAIKWGYIVKNPADAANTPRSDTKEAAVYDDAQCAALLTALEAAPLQYRCAIALALFSQIRKGELAGLDWSHVDLDKGVITICQNAVYIQRQGVVVKQPKTKAGNRTIVIPGYVVGLFRDLRRQQVADKLRLGDIWRDSGAVFASADGARIHPDTIPKWFTEFLEAQGLPHIRFHAIRHTGASLMIANGEDVVTVSRRLGHADAHTTLKTYAHAFEKQDHGAADRLEQLILGQKEPV